MTIHFDHTIVPARDQVASAKLLAGLLDVPWAAMGAGSFSPVYANNGLTLDFQDTDEQFHIYHFCFRVSREEFDAMLERIKTAGFTIKQGNNMYVNLEPDTRTETRRLFDALAKNGVVKMPLSAMFWGAYFGGLTDQFGANWMLNCEGKS